MVRAVAAVMDELAGADPSQPASDNQPGPVEPPVSYTGGPASAARASFKLPLKLVIPTAGLLALAAGGTLALALFLKPTGSLDRMIPASAGAYAVASLSPSIGQQMNLLALANKFPEMGNPSDIDSMIEKVVDAMLKDSKIDTGLTYRDDIKPWLGSQVALVVGANPKGSSALLLADKDDSRARSALAKLRTSAWGQKETWSDETYQGIAISTGSIKNRTATDVSAYALVDHTVVVAGDASIIRQLIDTDQGRSARLTDSADYKATVALLPQDRLLTVYANGKSIVDMATGKMGKTSSRALTPALSKLDYFKSAGFALTAERNGLAGDLEVRLDPSRMDSNTRAAVSIPSHQNLVLKWIPRSAYGFFALDSLKPTLQSLLSAADPNNQSGPALGALGLTGPNGALEHLTGDAGLEIDGTGTTLGGSILIATDNEAATRRTLDQLLVFAGAGAGRTGSPSVRRVNYHGVPLTSIALNDAQFGSLGIQPTFAVTGGMAIIGTSLAEVEGVIDAHAANATIASSSAFVATVGKGGTAHSILYVDIARTVSAIGRIVPASGRAQFQTLANRIAPLKALGLTATGGQDRLSERLYLLIQ